MPDVRNWWLTGDNPGVVADVPEGMLGAAVTPIANAHSTRAVIEGWVTVTEVGDCDSALSQNSLQRWLRGTS